MQLTLTKQALVCLAEDVFVQLLYISHLVELLVKHSGLAIVHYTEFTTRAALGLNHFVHKLYSIRCLKCLLSFRLMNFNCFSGSWQTCLNFQNNTLYIKSSVTWAIVYSFTIIFVGTREKLSLWNLCRISNLKVMGLNQTLKEGYVICCLSNPQLCFKGKNDQ